VKRDSGTGSAGALLAVLDRVMLPSPPIWFMRQAGRYLPEYREVRARAGGFVELCLEPGLAAEVTLQPVRRFGLDAAIIFSDILIVPHALGVKLWFEDGEGPRLEPVDDRGSFGRMRETLNEIITERVYEAIRLVRGALGSDVALIGFCGAPWTVASYLIAGRGTTDQAPAKNLMRADEVLFGEIVDRLADATAAHLIGQIEAGADVVQIFDTWAGALEMAEFERWCVGPTEKIVAAVRAKKPNARVIVFPKGVALERVVRLAAACGADAVSLDAGISRKSAKELLGGSCALQGNLAPEVLLAGGAALDREIDQILEDFRGAPHIFNLGHGILKETPVKHVEQMVARVRRGA
jgi:uroporphyrinogen decarboxylase